MKKLIPILLSLTLVLAIAPAAAARDGGRGTIADIVAASGGEFDGNRSDYDILLTALQAADLVGALADPEATFTVFAPNDGAFIRTARELGFEGRGEGRAWRFLVAAFTEMGGGDPIPVLTDVLLYHVAPGYYGAYKVIFSRSIPTLLDGANIRPFWIILRDNDPQLRNPRLVLRALNIRASNGVIHTINRVLIPVDLP